MNSRRKYDNSGRATAAQSTRRRIVDAMIQAFRMTPYPDIRIEDVAASAGVTAQTVFRHFGTKAALTIAAITAGGDELDDIQNAEAAAGTLDAFIAALIATQQQFGDALAKMWAEAHFVDGLPEVAAAGRAEYLAWLRRGIQRHLPTGLSEPERAMRIAQVIAVCDTASWKLLREDGGLSPDDALAAYADLIRSTLRAGSAQVQPDSRHSNGFES